jgi:hypothetical protein
MKVLAIDPGTSHTGWAIVRPGQKGLYLEAAGHLQSHPKLKGMDAAVEIAEWMDEIERRHGYKYEIVVIESYFPRSRTKGMTGTIGLTGMLYYIFETACNDVRWIQASTWKRWLKKRGPLEDLYAHDSATVGKTQHELDAMGMAAYYLIERAQDE